MLTFEKLSRRPVTLRRLAGVDIALFPEICKKILIEPCGGLSNEIFK